MHKFILLLLKLKSRVKTTVKKASSGVEDAIAVALAAIMAKRS